MKQKVLIAFAIVLVFLICVIFYFLLSNKKYIVTFDSNGGNMVEKIVVKKGHLITNAIQPVRDGYEFLYWTLDNKEFDFKTTKITKDITLVAKWEKSLTHMVISINPKLLLDIEGVKIVNIHLLNEDAFIFEPKELVGLDIDSGVKKVIEISKENGYLKDSKSISISVYDNEKNNDFDSIISKLKKDGYIVEKNVLNKSEQKKVKNEILIPNEYIVTFDTGGGSKINSIRIIENRKVSKPNDPTRDGYKFKEWTLDDKTYDFNKKVIKNIILKATWTKNSVVNVTRYIVTFDTDGGNNISSQSIESGKTISRPSDPTKSGYKFSGWTLNGNSYNFSKPITGNITLKATWTKVEVKKEYTATVSLVDAMSVDRYITISENGTPIQVSKLMYSDGTEVACAINGVRISVAYADIKGETSFKVKLTNGTLVNVSVR